MTTASIGQRLADGLVRAYQRSVSRGLNEENESRCIYTPSCSHYAQEALEKQGAFDGLVDAAGRLARCNHAYEARHREQFVEQLKACRDDQEVASRFRFDDERAKDVLVDVRQTMETARRLEAQGRTGEAEVANGAWRRRLDHEIHVVTEDHPDAHGVGALIVSSEHRHDLAACHPSKSEPSRRAGLLRRGLQVVGGVTGSLVGAAVGAVFESALTGFVLAPIAASGRTGALRGWLAQRCGDEGADALANLADKATLPAAWTRRGVAAATRSSGVASVLATVVGVPCGIVQGVVHGALAGASWGWRSGWAAGSGH